MPRRKNPVTDMPVTPVEVMPGNPGVFQEPQQQQAIAPAQVDTPQEIAEATLRTTSVYMPTIEIITGA